MNSFIESLNTWGARFFDVALPILWQSSLLIAVVFAVDFFLRRKIRPAVRYTLWFVVFIKLLVPPTLALPTGAAWWLRMRPVQIVVPHPRILTVSYSEPAAVFVPPASRFVPVAPPPPQLSRDAGMFLVSILVSVLLAGWSVFRWRQIARCVRKTTAATSEIQEMLAEAICRAGLRKNVRLRVTAESMSPAVCGLFRPVVLLPQSLIERLTPKQLQAVLLHELIHLRRCDVWVNCAQTLLQIVYWWHPLLWFANARARRVREEAVDDAVMFALNDEAEIYAPTLLEVAKLAFNRPLATLGLVGILESRNALRHRIERLLNFTTPRRMGVSAVSVMCLAAFTALAVPMGEPPARTSPAAGISEDGGLITFHAKVNPEIFMRNLKARANETMHSTNDDPGEILALILDGFGVDCAPPRNITFNAETGQISTKNSSEALGIVDEVVKELSLPGGERILNPPQGLKQVLIEAQFYLMPPEGLTALHLQSRSAHNDGKLSPWWELSSEELNGARQRLKEIGVEPISSPRIQTTHGMNASVFIGDQTNSVQFECVPYVRDGIVSLTALARTTGTYHPEGKPWPDLAGQTNCAIFSRVSIPDGSGVALVAQPAGTTARELILLLRAKIVEPTAAANRGGANIRTNGSSGVVSSDQAKSLVEDGKLLYQLGRIEEADGKFNKALAIEPANPAALYYSSVIKQSRNLQELDARTSPHPIPAPNLYGQTNGIRFTNPERQKIYDKLTTIHFDKIAFQNLSLSEVVRTLAEQTQRRDVDQKGINFVLNRTKPAVATRLSDTNAPVPIFDPATGQQIPNGVVQDLDLGDVKISVDPALRDVRLLDVLEAIVKSSDHPIKYSLLDYGIEFSSKGPEVLDLHTRTFKVDPNTLFASLQNIGVLNFGNGSNAVTSVPQSNATSGTGSSQKPTLGYVTGLDSSTKIQWALVTFFNAVGVNLAAPKSLFFNARQGTLTVHATDDDLELIEQAINTLNMAPLEVTIKVRFVEVDQSNAHASGFDWYLGNILISTNKMAGAGSTQPSPASRESLLTSGLRNTNGSAAMPSVTGILTDPQFRTVLKALEERNKDKFGTLLSEGEVTTLSGRPANFQTVDVQTIVKGVDVTVMTNKAVNYNYQITNLTFGTTLDVVPYVCADGYTIQLTVTPTVTEFLGYENPKEYSKYDKKLEQAQLPLLKYRNRQVTTSANVWDGQTLVLGNLNDETIISGPNGAKLRQPYAGTKKKQLLIFITPTIVDQAGNRVHNEPVSKGYYDSPVVY